MTALRTLTALVLALVAAPVRAQSDAPTTTTIPAPQTEFATTVKGTLPDLTGRWLAVCWLEIPGGQIRTTTSLLEIERQDGQLKVRMPYTRLADKQNAAMEQSAAANKRWEPSGDDLAEIASGWDHLPRQSTHPARLDNYLTGRDAFDATFTSDAHTRDAQWVLQQTETFDASAAPAVRQVAVYGAVEARDGGYRGNFLTTLLAAAPFPIPITFTGTFELIKIEPPRQGLLARLADALSGCGRR